MSTESESLQNRLRSVQEGLRRQHLSDELNDLAEVMEETILQRVLAEAFFDEELVIESDAKEEVEEVMELLEQNEYEAVDQRLDDLETAVETAATTVTNRIQELRLQYNATVAAMQRLNERVDRVSDARLNALEGLLGDWRWKEHVYTPDAANAPSLEQLKSNATQYGEEMQSAFEGLKDELFGAYPDEIRTLVHRMIDDERLSYADLTDKQRQLLVESDIGEYIELTLS